MEYDKDAQFTGNFWKALFKLMGSVLFMSTSYNLEIYGHIESINGVLEDYLWYYVSNN